MMLVFGKKRHFLDVLAYWKTQRSNTTIENTRLAPTVIGENIFIDNHLVGSISSGERGWAGVKGCLVHLDQAIKGHIRDLKLRKEKRVLWQIQKEYQQLSVLLHTCSSPEVQVSC
jgi:hypothetical protein